MAARINMAQDWLEQLQSFRETLPASDNEKEPSETLAENHSGSSNSARLDIIMEKKGRGGKTATIITGWNGDDDELAELAATLKKKIGTGGSVRGGEILIQGDRRQQLESLIKSLGHKCRII